MQAFATKFRHDLQLLSQLAFHRYFATLPHDSHGRSVMMVSRYHQLKVAHPPGKVELPHLARSLDF